MSAINQAARLDVLEWHPLSPLPSAHPTCSVRYVPSSACCRLNSPPKLGLATAMNEPCG